MQSSVDLLRVLAGSRWRAGNFPKHQHLQETTINMIQGLNREEEIQKKLQFLMHLSISQCPQVHLSSLNMNIYTIFFSFQRLLYITFSKSCMDLIIFSSCGEIAKKRNAVLSLTTLSQYNLFNKTESYYVPEMYKCRCVHLNTYENN